MLVFICGVYAVELPNSIFREHVNSIVHQVKTDSIDRVKWLGGLLLSDHAVVVYCSYLADLTAILLDFTTIIGSCWLRASCKAQHSN